MVGRPPPRPSPANCAGEGGATHLVGAGSKSTSPRVFWGRCEPERVRGRSRTQFDAGRRVHDPSVLFFPLPEERGGRGRGRGRGWGLRRAARCRPKRDRILPFLPRSGGEGPGERGPCRAPVRSLSSSLRLSGYDSPLREERTGRGRGRGTPSGASSMLFVEPTFPRLRTAQAADSISARWPCRLPSRFAQLLYPIYRHPP
jgi:hypothetical protein